MSTEFRIYMCLFNYGKARETERDCDRTLLETFDSPEVAIEWVTKNTYPKLPHHDYSSSRGESTQIQIEEFVADKRTKVLHIRTWDNTWPPVQPK